MSETTRNEKTKRQKAIFIGIILGLLFGAALLAYAVSSYFISRSFEIGNTKGSLFTMDLTGAVAGIEVLPGSEQSVNTTISNRLEPRRCMFL